MPVLSKDNDAQFQASVDAAKEYPTYPRHLLLCLRE